MAEENAEAELDWSGQPSLLDEDTFYAMEGLQATLQQLEAELRQKDVSEQSSTEYCDNFCQALMHFAGSRNSVEHGLALLEVYCLSINCFAAARPYLTADSSSVTLVLKRLALSCLELLLSVPHNEIPLEAWLQFHGSVQAAHEAMLQYGSTDLQALLNITGEGGAWNNPVLVSLLTSQPTEPDKVNDYLALEGEGFMEMRIKHLEKVGEVEKALILNKACANCPLLPNQATFRQTFVTQLCQMLPSEEAIIEISRIDGKDVLDIICNMETEGDENTAFVLCTTYFTQQLQQESLYCAWELTLLWSKLQRRIDASLESFFERCLQFGAIAKTIYHLLFLIRVIQTEAMQLGLAISVELCVKALQLPRQDDVDARTMVCKTVACLFPEDLEVIRGCQLTEFLLSPCQEAFDILKELYTQPDQKYDEENGIIPNFLRCELLLSLKAHWPFDPEFWDWKTLKRHCIGLLGLEPEEEDEAVPEEHCNLETVLSTLVEAKEEDKGEINGLCSSLQEQTAENTDEEVDQESFDSKDGLPSSQRSMKWQDYKFTCKICNKETVEVRICHHAKKHLVDNLWTCPFCLKKFKNRPQFVKHAKKHIQMPSRVRHFKKKKVKKKVVSRKNDFRDEGFDDLEPGQIPLDPSLAMYYQSTHDPVVLEHILEQAASVPKKQEDEDYITFDYINTYFKLQDRDVYQCPATDCSKNFKLFKYLGVHVKNEHDNEDPNVKHYLKMKDSREKCAFCRKTFMTAYHHRKHRHVHYGDNPYICVVSGCGARFNTTTELVLHKQSHGFRLSYSCELKGCSFSYCDLGQLYHHEAQHFRDAAYTCTSPGCKHFFYSRKEFLKHLAIHGITFTEKDFDMQRKAKKKKLLAVVDNMGPELDNDTQKSLSSPNLECSESKASLTCVAVCFDGKKFTCGLKQCGGTFTTARDLQRHLKNAHKDEYVNEDNLCKKTAQAKESMSQDDKLHKNDLDCIARSSTEETTQEKAVLTVAESLDSNTTPSNVELCASLCEIMQGFSQLSLSSTAPLVRRNSPRSVTASKLPVVVCPPTLNAKSPAKASPSKKTEVRSHLPGSDSKNPENLDDKKDYVKEKQEEFEQPINKTYKCKAKNCSYQTVSFRTLMQHYNRVHHYSEDEVKQMKLSQSDSEPSETLENSEDTVSLQGHDQSEFLLQATTKPYTCEAKSCQYQSVTSKALMKHYINIHGYSEKEVKEMEVFQLTTFRPFKCHLCTKSYKNKKQLKIHYINVHQIKRAIVAQMSCAFKRKTTVLSSSKKKKSSKSLKMVKGQAQRRDNGLWSQRCPNRDDRLFKSKGDRKNGQVQTEEKRPGSSESSLPEQVALEGDSRGSRRLATKGNQSYILNKYNNHFHCVHKNCSSAFSTQKGLVSHLQSVHHYNPSQLCFSCEHKGCDKQFNHYSSLTRHYHRVHNPSKQSSSEASTSKTLQATSEEPIPRFKCTYANCNQSYHLNSSLLRHTSQFHQNQSPNSDFKQSYNKHVFYRHCEASDSLVVRLQSNPIKDDSNSGCQTKLIILPSTQQPKDSQKLPLRQSLKCCQRDQPTTVSEENFEPAQESAKETDKVPAQLKFKTKSGFDLLLFRTHEEALQMCQDRCQPAAFPCVLQDCDSVLTRMSSLHRHYLQCHKLSRTQLKENQAKLCYTTEQLEEIIQKKSAVSAIPDVTRIPSGVLKMEYQSEPVTPGGPSLPMSLHSIKPEPTGQDVITFSGEPRPDSNLLIAADDLLYGESNGHPEEPISEEARSPKECSMLAAPPLIRPPPLDLSPPSTLRIAVDDSSLEPLAKDNCSKTVSISVANPARQPLRRRNTLSESAAVTPHSPISKDPVNHTLVPQAFDIGTYKPLGFESSFLKFIKEKEEEIKYDRQWTAVVTTPCLKPDPPRRRECFRRSCSVKENSQSRAAISRSRRFRSSPLRHLISKEECTSIQNFRLILERALRGCGDQAIKQLQFLKPVVVLERPKSSASILDLLPPETKV